VQPHPRTISDVWPLLPLPIRLRLYWTFVRAHHRTIIRYTVRAIIWTTILFIALPQHPMTIPTAVGGGLSFAMLIFPDN
jgi:hypothetical protein